MEEDIKELEKQRDELERKIKQYYKDEEKERIKRHEDEFVGRCFKSELNDVTLYYKILSGLTGNSYCYMHRMSFWLPVDPGFRPVLRMHGGSEYEYKFSEDIIEFDDTLVKNMTENGENVEISVEEFESALAEFGEQLIELSRKDFTMNGEYFNKYNRS